MKVFEILETQLKTENNFVTDEGELKIYDKFGRALAKIRSPLDRILQDNKLNNK